MTYASQEMISELTQLGIEYQVDVELANFTYLKAGGVAKIVIFPKDTMDVSSIMSILNSKSLKYKVVGNTSNLLFHDNIAYSILISTIKMDIVEFDQNTETFSVQAGVMMPELSRQALNLQISGFEGLEGIPGTVGGGLFMNAGAYGYELKDVFKGAEVVHPDGAVEIFSAAQFDLGHRTSILRKDKAGSISTTLYFKGRKGHADKIFSEMEMFHAKRHKYQDFMYPNLGSIFSGSPYRVLGRRDRTYRYLSAVYFLFRYEFKIFHRESPINRKWLNDLAVKRFEFLRYPIQPFSDKTLNCLVNRGQGTEAMVQFIRDLENFVGGEIPIENEIVEAF